MDNALLYVAYVYETFHDETEKFQEFLKLAEDATATRINEASSIAKMTQLMKGHWNCLKGLSVFFPNAKIIIPLDPEQLIVTAPENFMKNLEIRFQSVDINVVESFHKIMEEYNEGKMYVKEMYEEVISLLYYHEDLIEEFSRCYKRIKYPKDRIPFIHKGKRTIPL